MSQPAAIEFEDLRKVYREGFLLKKTQVLFDLGFRVPAGEIFGFLGANGAGKTTTIKLALGLQRPDNGRIRIFGEHHLHFSAKERIGYLPERPYFQQNFTANEFLNFHRGLFPSARTERSRDNEELFRLVGLPGIGSHFLRGFSKGMLQRIGIAQCLVNDPDLLILDEPMSGLDPVGRRDMRNLIVDMHNRGKTIFFSSHIIGDVEALCSQIAFLEKGRLKYSGKVADLLSAGSQDYEVQLRVPAGSHPAWLAGASPLGDRLRLLVKGNEEAKRIAQLCWSEGGEILAFNPVHRSLEEALFGKAGK